MRSGARYRSGSVRGLVEALGCCFAALLLVVLVNAPTAAAATKDLTWSVTIDERRVAPALAGGTAVDRNDPLVLRPESSPHLVIDLANRGSRELRVRSVRVDGRVIGLSFFSYTTRIDVTLPPGASTRREVDLDLEDLGSQAVGWIPARVQLLGADRTVLDQGSFPVDVKGSALSVYAVFGLVVAGFTVLLLASLLLLIARRRLPENRWKRAMLFLPAGAGLGMTATFTLSATRQLTPVGSSWLALVSGFALVAFVLGYFLPLGFEPSTAETGPETSAETSAETGATPGAETQFDGAERAKETQVIEQREGEKATGVHEATS